MTVLCLNLTASITVILNKIPVTHVEYSSTDNPICYWISMLFHMKRINSRRAWIWFQNYNLKAIHSESSKKPSHLRPAPSTGRASSQLPSLSVGHLHPSKNTRLAPSAHKQKQRAPVSKGKSVLLRGTLFL